ncbi:MAG: CHAT domain-containing tetratricopeptide repeat protein [Cyanobacteria bacterium P01_F01_bin.150]
MTCTSLGRSGSVQAMETNTIKRANERVQQGLRQYEAGEYQDAIETWESVLEVFRQANATEKESALSFLISQAYFALGDIENYQVYYDRGIELNPEAVQPFTPEFRPCPTCDQVGESGGEPLNAEQAAAEGLQTYIEGWQGILRLSRLSENTVNEIGALSNLGVTYYNQGDVETGISYHQQALDVARRSQNQAAEAEALRQIGHGHFTTPDYLLALEHYAEALAIFRQIQHSDQEAQVLISLGQVHTQLEDDEQALSFYQQAVDVSTTSNHLNTTLSALIYSGETYIALQQCEPAVRSLNQALTLSRELRDPSAERFILNQLDDPVCKTVGSDVPEVESQEFSNPQTEADALVNRGRELYEAGQIQVAIESWQAALVLHQESNNCIAEAQTHNILGNAFLEANQYEQAVTHQQLAVSKSRQSNDQQSLLTALGDLGNVFLVLNQSERAIEYYEETLAIAKAINDQQAEANTLGHLGTAYLAIGRYEEAIPLHHQYLELAQSLNNRTMEAHAQLNLGSLYQVLGQPWDAIHAYQAGLDIAHDINHQAFVIDAYGNLASVYSAWLYADSMDDSVQYYQLQFEAARRMGDIDAQGFALRGMGLNYWKRYQLFNYPSDLDNAETFLKEAIALWERLRPETLTAEHRLSLLDSQLNPYLILQQVLIQNGQAGAALEVAEQSRTQVLKVELLRHLPDQQAEQWSKSPDLSTIQAIAASQNATLVEYSYSAVSNELMIWVIQPDGTVDVRSHNEFSLAETLAQAGLIIAQANTARGAGESRGNQRELSRADRTMQLAELHRMLIDPITDLLPQDEQEKVIFIPFGALFQVPFAALRDASGQYLIESHAIAIAPSIQSLAFTQEHRQRLGNKPGPALLVGNPSFPSELAQAYDLEPLKAAEAEVRNIALSLGISSENVLIGAQGTETAVKAKLHSARMIHLATHGLLLETPRYSAIPGLLAFAPSSQDDGILDANEIVELTKDRPLNAELVVLSACQTGRGDITSDGIYGLPRAFLTAGVPSVIVSLRDVPDNGTQTLMTEFYKALLNTNDKAQALRQAMLVTTEEYPDPLIWGAFVLIGQSD